jgi:hypothetical protein
MNFKGHPERHRGGRQFSDIVRVREGNSYQPLAAVVQTVEQKYGLRKGSRSSDSGLLDLLHHD